MEELQIVESPEKAMALYEITPKEITELLKKFDTIKVIPKDTKSYKQVRSYLTAIVHLRTTGDKRRKDLGKKLRDGLSHINEGWRMLFASVVPYEERFKAELEAEDDRKQAIKEAKEAEERERVEAIQGRIEEIKAIGFPLSPTLLVPELVKKLIEAREVIIDATFQEFQEDAFEAKDTARESIKQALDARRKQDKEDADRKAEDERLAQERDAQEAKEKVLEDERKVIEAEKQKISDEKAQIAADKKTEEDRKERERRDEEIRKETKLTAEKDAKDKVAREGREKADKEEADRLEKERREKMRPVKERLVAFYDAVMAFSHSKIVPSGIKDEKAENILLNCLDEIETAATKLKEAAEGL